MMNESDDLGTKISDGRISVTHPDVVALWDLLNIYRDGGNENLEFTVLLIIAFYRDGYITERTTEDHLTVGQILVGKEGVEPGLFYQQYIDLFNTVGITEELRNTVITRKAFEVLSKVQRNGLQSSYIIVFDAIINKSLLRQYSNFGLFTTPKEIISLMSILGDVKRGGLVYNPFAGPAFFSTSLPNDIEYLGQEINTSIWQLGYLRTIGNDKYRNDYRLQNTLETWPENQLFDLIISAPPFGIKIEKEKRQYREVRNAEQFVIRKGIDQLESAGRMVVLVTQSFLFSQSNTKLRELLIEEDLLESIISLPMGTFPSTAVLTSIIVISKRKVKPGIIQMIDGSPYFQEESRASKRLIQQYLLEDMKVGSESDNVKYVTTAEVRSAEYFLTPNRFSRENFYGLPLSHFIEPLKSVSSNLPEDGKLVTISDLRSEDDILFELEIEGLNSPKKYKRRVRQINESCTLVALQGSSLKPTSFNFQGTPVYISSSIEAFVVSSKHSFPDYLVNTLREESVKKQVEIYGTTVTIPSIRKSDFLKIKVELPPLEQQHAKIQSLYEVAKKFEALKSEREAIATGTAIANFDDFSSLKHSLGMPRQDILTWARAYQRFFSGDDLNEVNEKFAQQNDGTSLLDSLVMIKDSLKKMGDLLVMGEQELFLTPAEVPLVSHHEIYDALDLREGNTPDREVTLTFKETQGLEAGQLQIDVTLFGDLIDNIINNAVKHGGKGLERRVHIHIVTSIHQDYLELSIGNNGTPFPPRIGKTEFIRRHKTTDNNNGSGEGGYRINQLATNFGDPDWELILDEKSSYPVCFIFRFPYK